MLGGSVSILNVQIAKCVLALRPKAVLEFGCGWGKFGAICKQISALPDQLTAVQKLFTDNDLATITENGYTEVIDDDVFEYVKKGLKPSFDMIVAIDVIEHFFYGDAMSIIDYSLYNCDYFLVVWPSRLPQNIGAEYTHNTYDIHRTSFELSDLATRFDVVYYVQGGLSERAATERYHLALIRGHMNTRTLNPPIA